jgi:hypothetical protein
MPITGTLTTDKVAYTSGDKMTATIVRHAVSAPASHQDVLNGPVTDAEGDTITFNSAPVTISTPGQPIASTIKTVTDSDGRTFTQVSDDGVTWVGTATA